MHTQSSDKDITASQITLLFVYFSFGALAVLNQVTLIGTFAYATSFLNYFRRHLSLIQNDKAKYFRESIALFILFAGALPFTFYILETASEAINENSTILFLTMLCYLLVGYFAPIFLGMNKSAVVLALNLFRFGILLLPYVWTADNVGLAKLPCIKDALVISLLLDTCIDKTAKLFITPHYFSGKLYCDDCGRAFKKRFLKQEWYCSNQQHANTNGVPPILSESVIQNAFIRALNQKRNRKRDVITSYGIILHELCDTAVHSSAPLTPSYPDVIRIIEQHLEDRIQKCGELTGFSESLWNKSIERANVTVNGTIQFIFDDEQEIEVHHYAHISDITKYPDLE